MKRKYIRWIFLAAFVVFMAVMRETRLMNLNANLFIILWLIASYIAVFGVVYFKDKDVSK